MPYYPVLLNLEERKVLVIGGGKVAQRKIESLLECGAEIQVVARELAPALERWKGEKRLTHLATEFQEAQLQNVFMVIGATDSMELNHRVSIAAQERGILANAVDQPADCSFIVPSVLRQGDLLIAVSTSGKSPALAKKIRERLEREFGREYALLLNLMGHIRNELLKQELPQGEKQRIFRELAQAPLLENLAQRKWEQIAATIQRIVSLHWSPGQIILYSGIND